jgi:hypothetical protein
MLSISIRGILLGALIGAGISVVVSSVSIFIISKLLGVETGEQFHSAINSSWALFLWTRGVNAVVPIARG